MAVTGAIAIMKEFSLKVLSRDLSNFVQDGLETLVLSGFDNLLLP